MDNHDTHITPNSQSNSHKTFAETTANSSFPKKDQAIIFNTVNDVPQIEYIKAFSQLTSPNNIKFASRISNNRFCIYFASKSIVDHIISKQSYIVINNTQIAYRRLISPAKRIIISNVQPSIPHDIIIKAINNSLIKILSPITFMKAGFSNDEYGHIGSFRRQVYLHPDDIHRLPSSLLINYDQTDYRIFFSDDTVLCYICKQTGHTSNHCKKDLDNTILTNSNIPPPPENKEIEKDNNSQNDQNIMDHTNINHSIENNYQQSVNKLTPLQEPADHIKRPISSYASTSDTDNASTTENPINTSPTTPTETQNHQTNNSILTTKLLESQSNEKKKTNAGITHNTPLTPIKSTNISKPTTEKSKKNPQPANKKIKRSNSIELIVAKLDETLAPAITVFEGIPNRKIDFNQLKYIIENSLSVDHPSNILNQFNITPMEMIEILDTIRPKIKNLSIKNRLTRLCNSYLESL
ncbi:unnamed protein product [Macrosiphum euphorbiae]|uniref:CCHC-type domain-containing protein n=1 Tax=Macrosiphum euphorbiae TaxID=13131 RepID=A0AAV0VV74_9HEMI|nr:unnamed protein product [Macrosiphum euphorbiae]